MSGRRHRAVCCHTERNIRRYQISVRRNCLAQRVFNAGLQALDHMVAVCSGNPLVNNLVGCVLHHQVSARNFLAVCDVSLLDFDVDGRILHHQHGVAVFVLAGRAGARYLAHLVDAEGRIAGNQVSVRSNRLTQRVFNASLQSFDYIRLVAGHPFLHHIAVLVQDLQCRAGQFFVPVDILFAY